MKILVIDDDPDIRMLLCKILCFYVNIEAETLDKALGLPIELVEDVRLVILDCDLPDCKDPVLAWERLKRRSPLAKVLFISGWYNYMNNPPTPFLPKPFEPNDIYEILNKYIYNGRIKLKNEGMEP